MSDDNATEAAELLAKLLGGEPEYYVADVEIPDFDDQDLVVDGRSQGES